VQVAGGASGISAFQMDIKVEGITLDIMRQVRRASPRLSHAAWRRATARRLSSGAACSAAGCCVARGSRGTFVATPHTCGGGVKAR
jgi:hypothetical protein